MTGATASIPKSSMPTKPAAPAPSSPHGVTQYKPVVKPSGTTSSNDSNWRSNCENATASTPKLPMLTKSAAEAPCAPCRVDRYRPSLVKENININRIDNVRAEPSQQISIPDGLASGHIITMRAELKEYGFNKDRDRWFLILGKESVGAGYVIVPLATFERMGKAAPALHGWRAEWFKPVLKQPNQDDNFNEKAVDLFYDDNVPGKFDPMLNQIDQDDDFNDDDNVPGKFDPMLNQFDQDDDFNDEAVDFFDDDNVPGKFDPMLNQFDPMLSQFDPMLNQVDRDDDFNDEAVDLSDDDNVPGKFDPMLNQFNPMLNQFDPMLNQFDQDDDFNDETVDLSDDDNVPGRLDPMRPVYSKDYLCHDGSVVPLTTAFVIKKDAFGPILPKLAGYLTLESFEDFWECLDHLIRHHPEAKYLFRTNLSDWDIKAARSSSTCCEMDCHLGASLKSTLYQAVEEKGRGGKKRE
jgi:hypothetical protein